MTAILRRGQPSHCLRPPEHRTRPIVSLHVGSYPAGQPEPRHLRGNVPEELLTSAQIIQSA